MFYCTLHRHILGINNPKWGKEEVEVLYEITAAEDVGIRKAAEARQRNKQIRQISSKRFDLSKTDLEIHLEGMRAEFAAQN